MRRTRGYLIALATAALLFATAAAAMAETCTLTHKRRETKSPAFDRTSYMYWTVRPQYFFLQIDAQGKAGAQRVIAGNQPQLDAFKRIVTKEPKYQSQYPFRGVIKLGSQEYAFALDVAAPPPAPKAKSPDGKETPAKPTTEAAASSQSSSLVTKLRGALTGEESAAKPAIAIKAYSYNRLYFDFNQNGDLTDDKVVELRADSNRISPAMAGGMSYASFEFPRIDVTIDVDGTKLAHSFYLEGHVYSSPTFGNVQVSVSSAVCREGDITLEGKRHHLVLLDYNSNGRFDDETKISQNIHLATGQVYPEYGDMLLIDPPKVGATAFDSPYDPTTGDYRYYVSKMIPIDGRWYDLSISSNGEKLTLTASTVPLGSVTNGNEAFHALIYGDKGFLKIQGTKGTPIPVPEGEWKLFSYTITHANSPEPAKPAAKAAEKKNALLDLLAKQLTGTITGGEPFVSGPSLVSATATDKCKAVTVRKDETVEFPFGPPYTPTVKAMNYGVPLGQREQVSLEMQLVGVSGEGCTNMLVKGGRPGKPDFTITDPDGKVVQQGSFEYG
ncbi:MAG: hypothetical protein ACLQNE_04235 [Thermoguttaceae bacterium]